MANTIERVRKYYNFDETIVEPLLYAADMQNRLSFDALLEDYGVDEASNRVSVNGKKIEYLRLTKNFPDNDTVDVLFAPMGNAALSPNIIMRALRYYEAAAPGQLYVFGGPANISNKNNLLSRQERSATARGDLSASVRPVLEVLARNDAVRCGRLALLGYSLGASLAQQATLSAHKYDLNIARSVQAEPATVKNRSLLKLIKDFQASGKELDEYVQAADSNPLIEATASARDDVGYLLGLVRPSSVAIARALSVGNYMNKTKQSLRENSGLTVVTAVGTRSVLSKDIVPRLVTSTPEHGPGLFSRHRNIILQGMHHAGADDIDLHAAIMMQGRAF